MCNSPSLSPSVPEPHSSSSASLFALLCSRAAACFAVSINCIYVPPSAKVNGEQLFCFFILFASFFHPLIVKSQASVFQLGEVHSAVIVCYDGFTLMALVVMKLHWQGEVAEPLAVSNCLFVFIVAEVRGATG